MYSLLLVDDEKIVREGVFELLSMADLDLDLYMAPSAVQALQILGQQKIDIVLMDICMPQMSGLELYDEILRRWPYCKMIFLTGHLEFDYVYKVHTHAKYVLKAEDDEILLGAVKETIQELENSLLLEQMLSDQLHHRHRSKYYERMLLLREMVDGLLSPSSVTQQMLDELDATLDISKGMYCVMLRCPALRKLPYPQQSQCWDTLGILIEKLLLEYWNGTYFAYNKNLVYVLLQPKGELPQSRTSALLQGHCETLQKSIIKNLALPLSVFVGDSDVDFSQAITDFSSIRNRMLSMDEGEIQVCSQAEIHPHGGADLPEWKQQELTVRAQQLVNQFDSMDRENVLHSILYMKAAVSSIDSNQNLFVLELYFSIVATMLNFVKKVGFSEESAFQTGVIDLYDISRFSSWGESFEKLYQVASYVFDHIYHSMENKNKDVIKKVKSYIKGHLDGDTSLYALSSHVHLCPEHLLRLFKKQEGITILQYINNLKLEKAKQMLSQTDTQIKDIATALGFTSSGYFGRFFKSKMGITPNVYRNQMQK